MVDGRKVFRQEVAQLLVVVNHEDVIVRLVPLRFFRTFRERRLRFFFPFRQGLGGYDVFRFQVFEPQGNAYHEAASLGVFPVFGEDDAVVQPDQQLAEVQPDAESQRCGCLVGVALIEALEDPGQLLFVQPFAGVGSGDLQVFVQGAAPFLLGAHAQADADASPLRSVFEGVAQQVGEHLVEVARVDPHRRQAVGDVEIQADVFLPGRLVEEAGRVFHKLADVGLGKAEAHLPLVDLPDVEQLVEEAQDAVGVPLHVRQHAAGLRVIGLFQHLVQGVDDERQGRADLVGDVDEELQLHLAVLLHPLPLQSCEHEVAHADGQQQVSQSGQRALVPGRRDLDPHRPHRRVHAVLAGTYLQGVVAGRQQGVLDAPFAGAGRVPVVFQPVQAVFIEDVAGVAIVHGGHQQGEVVVRMAQADLLGIDEGRSITGLPSESVWRVTLRSRMNRSVRQGALSMTMGRMSLGLKWVMPFSPQK